MSDIGGAPTDLMVAEEAGARFVEGPPGRQLMRSIEDAGLDYRIRIAVVCTGIGRPTAWTASR